MGLRITDGEPLPSKARRLHELARAPCQDFSKPDLRLWLTPDESVTGRRREPLNATALCQFVIDTEGMDRKGRF